MAQSDAERRLAAREMAKRIFQQPNATATMNLDDLKAAIASIDTAMDTVINTIPGGWQSKTIKQALIDNLPEPFQSTSTGGQKAMALSMWAMKEANLI